MLTFVSPVLSRTLQCGVPVYTCTLVHCHAGVSPWVCLYPSLLCPDLFPGQIFIVFFCMDMLLWAKGASNAVPFTTLLVLSLIPSLHPMPQHSVCSHPAHSTLMIPVLLPYSHAHYVCPYQQASEINCHS